MKTKNNPDKRQEGIIKYLNEHGEVTTGEIDSSKLTDCEYPDIIDLNIVSNQPGHDFYTTHLLTIEKAIQLGASIKVSNSTMTPHFIKRDVNTGILYVIQTYDEDNYIGTIPLHEINYVEIVYPDTYNRKSTFTKINSDNIYDSYINNKNTKSNRIPIPEETTARVDSIWSFDAETLDSVKNEEPTHIKLMIFEDNADIIENIKMDTYGRPRAKLNGPFPYEGKDHITTNVYYYEDDVLGLAPFKSWVKQLGASALVLEPRDLAYEIYRELHNK